jgi:hypothetical protein
MSDKITKQGKLAERIAKLLAEGAEGDDPYVFDKSEIESLQAVIAFVEKLRALRWFGKYLMWAVIAAGTMIVNWERIKIFFAGGQS